MTEFARLTAQFELSGFPEGLDALYDQYAVDYQPHALMRRGLIGELCARFDAGTQNEPTAVRSVGRDRGQSRTAEAVELSGKRYVRGQAPAGP